MDLPTIPNASDLLSPGDVDDVFNKQILELRAQVNAKKLSPEEFEQILRKMVGMKTNKHNPEDVVLLLKEIHEGSPHVPKSSLVKIKIPADNRVCLIIPDGHDDSMDKDMSQDIGSWGEGGLLWRQLGKRRKSL